MPTRTPFGWGTTADEAIAGIRLDGTRAIVTGGSSGIGAETARVLATAGAEVTLAVRDVATGEQVAASIKESAGDAPPVHVGRLDLADLASVRDFASSWSGPLHLLINNAGVMALPARRLTAGGWEMQFATNHLGHFALTTGLHDSLARGAATRDGGSRVVSLSSRGHLRAAVDFDDINFAARDYEPMIAYGQSKTANVLLAVGISQRWAGDGITANAVHPGAILETNLARHMTASVLGAVQASNRQQYKSIPQGAATSIVVATSPLVNGVTGRYFEDCNESDVLGPEVGDIPGHARGVAWYALDELNADRLWVLSQKATQES